MRYAVFIAAMAALFWWAVTHDWLPAPPPEAAVVAPPASQSRQAELPLEPVRQGLRDVTPQDGVHLPKPEGMLARLPAVVPPPPPPRPPKPANFALPVVVGAGILEAGGETIRLPGILPLAADSQCEGAAGKWPCGAFARTALQRYLRRRTIDCAAQGERDGGMLVTPCSVGGSDIGQWLVEQGWVRPEGDRYAQAAAQARKAGRGVWGEGPAPDAAGQ